MREGRETRWHTSVVLDLGIQYQVTKFTVYRDRITLTKILYPSKTEKKIEFMNMT
jgi:hypothetical protein